MKVHKATYYFPTYQAARAYVAWLEPTEDLYDAQAFEAVKDLNIVR